mmetsp:Transcript_8809/g.20631  ORF Transcript_8809/g.20631 Transcript_8809/m.20631 type:complete len:221 (+) Transcript_8809:2795-3457(+)
MPPGNQTAIIFLMVVESAVFTAILQQRAPPLFLAQGIPNTDQEILRFRTSVRMATNHTNRMVLFQGTTLADAAAACLRFQQHSCHIQTAHSREVPFHVALAKLVIKLHSILDILACESAHLPTKLAACPSLLVSTIRKHLPSKGFQASFTDRDILKNWRAVAKLAFPSRWLVRDSAAHHTETITVTHDIRSRARCRVGIEANLPVFIAEVTANMPAPMSN